MIQAQLFAPGEARDVGFLDEVVAADAVEGRALEVAAALAELPGEAYAGNKLGSRAEPIAAIKASLG